MTKACEAWTGPIVINGKTYTFPAATTLRDGNRVWSVSVALANTVSTLPFIGRAVELGAGLGLVGQVAGAVLIERDADTIPLTLAAMILNESRCELCVQSWDEMERPFDSIFGSEILYPAYDPGSIWRFVDRNWTRRGPVIFANSRWQHLDETTFPVRHTLRTFNGFEYAEWRCDATNL